MRIGQGTLRKQLMGFLAVALLAGLLVACGGSSKQKASDDSQALQSASSQDKDDASAQGSNSTTDTATKASKPDDLAKVYESFAKVKSFRANLTIEDKTAGVEQGTLESVVPDKMHFSIAAPGKPSAEFINIGTDSYVNAGGKWTKLPNSGSGKMIDQQELTDQIEALSTSKSVSTGGTDTVNGKKCQTYTTTDATDGSVEEFCIADSLPVRYVTNTGGRKTTVVFSDFNANIEIKAPI